MENIINNWFVVKRDHFQNECSSSNDDIFLLNSRFDRRNYLVTYSQSHETKFPTRESLAEMLETGFNTGTSSVNVDYWAYCREEHQTSGLYYHCSRKLTVCKKWLSVRDQIAQVHNVQVNFNDKHDNYISVCRYVCKSDTNVAHSNGHPEGLFKCTFPKNNNDHCWFSSFVCQEKKIQWRILRH